ncbi:reverse transcriptase domain-containing protein [Tanacetum coccineum]
MYPPTTSESSAGDSSSESSARLSLKRCRSPAATMTLSIYVARALVPSRDDILLPRKRFRDSISPEDSVKEDIDANELADIEADAMAIEVAIDRDVEAGVDAGIGMEVDVGVDVKYKVEDEVESSDRGTMEVGVDVVAGIDIPDGMLMPDAVERLEQVEEGCILGEEQCETLRHRDDRECESRKNMTITCSGMTPKAIEELVNRRVEEALASYEETHAANALEAESQSQNGSDNDNGNGRNGNDRNGNEGVVRLIRWFEKMETVFHISNYPEKYQVKYASCTLLNSALTWWNLHKRIVGTEAAFSMSWRELMKLMAEVYCPRNEIKKIESELLNLTVKNNDLAAYTQRFQELTFLTLYK